MAIEADSLSPDKRLALYYGVCPSPLGELYLILMDEELVGVEFERPRLRMGKVPELFTRELDAYFTGNMKEFSIPLKCITGTDFEQKVWLSLRQIPFGETRSYKWMAEKVGSPKGNRAVGQALSKNPIPIVLPCHRVIESSGKLGGYSSGEDIKRRLLAIEFYSV